MLPATRRSRITDRASTGCNGEGYRVSAARQRRQLHHRLAVIKKGMSLVLLVDHQTDNMPSVAERYRRWSERARRDRKVAPHSRLTESVRVPLAITDLVGSHRYSGVVAAEGARVSRQHQVAHSAGFGPTECPPLRFANHHALFADSRGVTPGSAQRPQVEHPLPRPPEKRMI